MRRKGRAKNTGKNKGFIFFFGGGFWSQPQQQQHTNNNNNKNNNKLHKITLQLLEENMLCSNCLSWIASDESFELQLSVLMKRFFSAKFRDTFHIHNSLATWACL